MQPFFADQQYLKIDYTQTPLTKGHYDNCVFSQCNFKGGYVDNILFTDCQFIDCDLSNSNIAHTQFNTVAFKKCKLVGVRFDRCDQNLLQISLAHCNASLACFYAMQLPNTAFVHCNLQQTDFELANLSKASFANCNLQNAIFSQTNLNQANFTTAINFDIDPSNNQVKKAQFSLGGLVGLLKKHDIVIH